MTNQTTYDADFYLWTQQQAALLRQGSLTELDTAHLLDEIEDMGANSRRAMESYLRNVMLHLLKWRYQPERRGTSWRLSIRDGRHQLAKRVKDSPSLRQKIPDMVGDEYPLAREYAAAETGLPLPTFPGACPFSVEQVLDVDYWPDWSYKVYEKAKTKQPVGQDGCRPDRRCWNIVKTLLDSLLGGVEYANDALDDDQQPVASHSVMAALALGST